MTAFTNLFILGVLMLLGGVSLLFLGEVKRGNKIAVSSRSARWIGIFLVSYFPLVLAFRLVLAANQWDKVVEPRIIHAALAAICLGAAITVYVRGRKRARKLGLSTVSIKPISNDSLQPEVSDSAPTPPPSPANEPFIPPSSSPQEAKNPFDFS